MDIDGPVCMICRKAEAKMVCKCKESETLLCSNCISAHYSAYPSGFHYMIPVIAREFVSNVPV